MKTIPVRVTILIIIQLLSFSYSYTAVINTSKVMDTYLTDLKSNNLDKKRIAIEWLISNLQSISDKDILARKLSYSIRNESDQNVRKIMIRCYIEVAKDLTWIDRTAAVQDFGVFCDSEAVSFLIQVLDNPRERLDAQKAAIRSLGLIGDKRAVPSLIKIFKNSDLWGYEIAGEALEEIGDKSAVESLKQVTSKDPQAIIPKTIDGILKYDERARIAQQLKGPYDTLKEGEAHEKNREYQKAIGKYKEYINLYDSVIVPLNLHSGIDRLPVKYVNGDINYWEAVNSGQRIKEKISRIEYELQHPMRSEMEILSELRQYDIKQEEASKILPEYYEPELLFSIAKDSEPYQMSLWEQDDYDGHLWKIPLAIDRFHNVYIGDGHKCRILKYSIDGKSCALIQLNKETACYFNNMFVDDSGNVYIENRYSKQKYDNKGALVAITFKKIDTSYELYRTDMEKIKSAVAKNRRPKEEIGIFTDMPVECIKIIRTSDESEEGVRSYYGKNKTLNILRQVSGEPESEEIEYAIIGTDLDTHTLFTITLPDSRIVIPLIEDKYENIYYAVNNKGINGIYNYHKRWIYKYNSSGNMLAMIPFVADEPYITRDGEIYQAFHNKINSVDIMRWKRMK